MPKHVTHEGGRAIDWSRASDDYAEHRPNYPDRFFSELQGRGVGLQGQRILDLGTGVGFLACQFAAQGSAVVGNDIAPGQIEGAKTRATQLNVAERCEFFGACSEELEFPDDSFDYITASQCWGYFDRELMLPRMRRWLKPGGRFMTSHFCWLPREDDVARQTETLMLKYSPDWKGADWPGEIPKTPRWAQESVGVSVADSLVFDEAIPFTHASWRGRIRASRAISTVLDASKVADFDAELIALLKELELPETFTIKHRIDAHFFEI